MTYVLKNIQEQHNTIVILSFFVYLDTLYLYYIICILMNY